MKHPALTRLKAMVDCILRGPVPTTPKLAVFIDGDGVSPKDAEKVLAQLPAIGRVCLLRCYGNYTGRAAQGWTRFIRKHGAVARHMPSIIPGKKATDIALTVDAIELLLIRDLDTFVLVVSDADFTPLARRLGEDGKIVVGYGNRSTPDAFRRSCAAFHEIQSLAPPITPQASLWSLLPTDAELIVLAALADLSEKDVPSTMQALGDQIAQRHPGFDCRVYSRRSLTELVCDLPSVTIIEQCGIRTVRRN